MYLNKQEICLSLYKTYARYRIIHNFKLQVNDHIELKKPIAIVAVVTSIIKKNTLKNVFIIKINK